MAERALTNPGKSRFLCPFPAWSVRRCIPPLTLADPLWRSRKSFPPLNSLFWCNVVKSPPPRMISFLATLALHHCCFAPCLSPKPSERWPQIAVAKILLLWYCHSRSSGKAMLFAGCIMLCIPWHRSNSVLFVVWFYGHGSTLLLLHT